MTYQSVQSATSDNTGTITITKPVSLAVGDLLMAAVWADRDGGSSASLNTPAGWTLEREQSGGSGNAALAIYTKRAESGDVAAADFTFTAGGSTFALSMIGHLMRFTNAGYAMGSTSLNTGAATTTLTLSGFTPTPARANSTYVIAMARSFGITPGAFSSVSIATSNPTWTNRASTTVTGSTTNSRMAVFTAVRTETTATGDATLTYATTDNTRSVGIMLGYVPQANGVITPTTKLNTYAFNPINPSATLDIILEAPVNRISNPAIWVSETKTATTWTPEIK